MQVKDKGRQIKWEFILKDVRYSIKKSIKRGTAEFALRAKAASS